MSETIVVDNSPDYAPIGSPDFYQSLKENPGLAYAQNVAINRARQKGATHILMLDQDSLPDFDMVKKLSEIYKTAKTKVAAVGPVYKNRHNGSLSGFMTLGYFSNKRYKPTDLNRSQNLVPPKTPPKIECDFLISSGTLFSVEAISKIGAMDETLFIDYIDTDWMLKAKAEGYKIYGAVQARMEHSLGEDCKRVWLGRWRTVPIHSAFRYYYIFRNSLLVQRKKYATRKWRWFELKRLVSMLGFLLLNKNRIEKLSFAVKGISDGIRGKSGPLALRTST